LNVQINSHLWQLLHDLLEAIKSYLSPESATSLALTFKAPWGVGGNVDMSEEIVV
jgi:hypothetical protein